MIRVSIDFETRNTVDIKAGASKYAKTAEILCMSYSVNLGPIVTWKMGDPDPDELLDAIEQGAVVQAHNAAFERAIWREVCVKQFGWPEVRTWRCTLARALYSGLPASLDGVSKAIGLSVAKDMDGRRAMLKMTKPRKMRKAEKGKYPEGTILWHDTPEHWEKLLPYCEQDVRVEQGVGDTVLDMTDREWGVYEYDAKVNARGVRIDRELAEACIKVWGKYTKTMNAELSDLTFGWVTSANQVEEMLKLLNTLGLNLGSVKKDAVNKTLAAGNLGPIATRTLEIRQSLAKSSVSKYKRMLQAADSDDRIRGMFQYHGARTGRWAGRVVQLHNLPRPSIKIDKKRKAEMTEEIVSAVKSVDLDRVRAYGPVGEVLSSVIRNAIIPGPGKRLIVSDFAQIEVRASAWLADEDWLIQSFVDSICVYRKMGEKIYDVGYDDITDDQRQKSKVVVLGAQYGLGGGGLLRQMEGYGIKVDLPFCDKLIKVYRKSCSKIVKLWYALDDAAISCLQTGRPKGIFGRRDAKLAFHIKGDWLAMRLPSGRDIHYYKPRLVPGKFGKPQVEYVTVDSAGKPRREHSYGGKWLENASQSVSRDVMVEAMAKAEKRNYDVVVHVHDELVSEVPIGQGSVHELEQIMSEPIEWAKGFPIGAEGFECTRYRK